MKSKKKMPKIVSALIFSLFSFVACEREESTELPPDPSQVAGRLNDSTTSAQILNESLSALVLDGDQIDLISSESAIAGSVLECPTITLGTIPTENPNLPIRTLILDYTALGCAHPVFNEHFIKGMIKYTYSFVEGFLRVEFTNYQIDLNPVLNGISEFDIDKTPGKIELAGSVDLSATNGTSVTLLEGVLAGYVSFQDIEVSIDEASFLVTLPNLETRSFQLNDIFINPDLYMNFVPESGSLSFTVPNDRPFGPPTINVLVQFEAHSPIDGMVLIQVGAAVTPVPYKLPWFE